MRRGKRAIATLAGTQGKTAALVALGSFHCCSQYSPRGCLDTWPRNGKISAGHG